MRWVLFTDLDGTLLDHDTYSWAPALPALNELKLRGAAVVLCTSKTRAELMRLRTELRLNDPFITENGAGVFIPEGYFGQPVAGTTLREGFEVLTLGAGYPDLLADLRAELVAKTKRQVIALPVEIFELGRYFFRGDLVRRGFPEPGMTLVNYLHRAGMDRRHLYGMVVRYLF